MEVNKFRLGATGIYMCTQCFFFSLSLSLKSVMLGFRLKVEMTDTLADVHLLTSLPVCMNCLPQYPPVYKKKKKKKKKKDMCIYFRNSTYIITIIHNKVECNITKE
jgi:hypothetical protein